MLDQKVSGFEIYNDEPDSANTVATCPILAMLGDSEDSQHMITKNITSRAPMSTGAKCTTTEPLSRPKPSQRHTLNTSPRIRARDQVMIAQNCELRRDSSYKEARRRKIHAPLENIAISTIHPEIYFSTHKSCIGPRRGLEISVKESGNIKFKELEKRTIRTPRNASKRAPLKPTLHILQDSTQTRDRPGSGPGKENLNSRHGATVSHKYDDSCLNIKKKRGGSEPETKRSCNSLTSSASNQLSEVLSRCTSPARSFSYDSEVGNEQPRYIRTAAKRSSIHHQRIIRKSFFQHQVFSESGQDCSITLPLNRIMVDFRTSRDVNIAAHPKIEYPLIREGISQPHMFADDWLDGMESVILQLANGVFEFTDQRYLHWDPSREGLRQSLLELYQDQTSVLLYRKLKVSLERGVLSIPQEFIPRSSSIRSDIGLQKRFIHIWTQSYNVPILRFAAEVVIGRKIPDRSNVSLSDSQTAQISGKQLEKLMENFIDSCLLRNEDASHAEKGRSQTSSVQYFIWSWRRTTLRSLMLVYLLDRSKDVGLFPVNLFLTTSTFKSSSDILKEISALLLSFLGDINRPLARLGYHGRHVQVPFDEYKYAISNLAVDFRDGVRLARLVELFISSTNPQPMDNDAKRLTTLRCKVSDNSAEGRKPGILSQRLKYPCPGRSQKIHNVQMILSAMHGLNQVGTIADDMKAESIVDGHREKTILILWSIVGKLGLELLIDFSDLQKETRKFQKLRKDSPGQDDPSDSDSDLEDDKIPVEGLKRQSSLLMAWAKSIAKLHEINIRDFTTSFADGAIFHKIVDEYIPYIPCLSPPRHEPVQHQNDLEEKLKALGCSVCFGEFSNIFLMVYLI